LKNWPLIFLSLLRIGEKITLVRQEVAKFAKIIGGWLKISPPVKKQKTNLCQDDDKH
jgi:hypothetical protein